MLAAILAITLGLLLRAVYRLHFHPLASIPGPRIVAVTSLVEMYYDLICGGRYLWQIEAMHTKYGPVVRTGPHDIHIDDPAFYTEICSAGHRKRNKAPKAVGGFRASEAISSIIDHDHHSLRRRQLNPMFSKKSISEKAPLLQQNISRLMDNLYRTYQHPNDGVVDLDPEISSLTADIVTQFAYGKDLRLINDKSFNLAILDGVREMVDQYHFNRFFPWFGAVLELLPSACMNIFRPKLSGLREFQKRLEETPKLEYTGSKSLMDSLNDPSLPPEARSPEFIRDNVTILLGAATDTTTGTLLIGLYHLARRRDLWVKLRSELKAAMPLPTSPPPWPDLEQLPLLQAVVNEVFRFCPVTIRSTRVPVSETLVCHGHVIPPGFFISSSARLIHMNEATFPNPSLFDPDRWLSANEASLSAMKQALVPFSKGSRNCIANYMATAEVYMVLAAMIRRFDIELYNTTKDDIAFARDCIVARPEKGVWRVRVRVTGVAS